ncbi:MAG: pyridoxal-dependent decarboxylase, exosortase A system-associated [Gammaproteobacteria bacterium]|nr:pyridoxal-dependent decarboxylase, exosortase A system-associated [Gammaproteobacteria bacterium]
MTAIEFETHAPITQFEVRQNCLWIGSRRITEWVTEAGATPVYVYDRKCIRDRIDKIHRALPKIDLHYAVKANPMPALVEFTGQLVEGLDVASAGELEMVLRTGFDPERISFAGPGKRDDELEAALKAGIIVNIESERELRVLAALGQNHNLKPRVAVRVNPPFQLRASGMRMSGGSQQFGVDSERVPALLADMKNLDVEFIGFHIFAGSQNLNADAICEAQRLTCQLAIDLSAHAPAPVQLLNIGGGLGVPYFPGDQPVALAPIAENLNTLLPAVRKVMPEARVALELGRYLVAEAGVYICRVIDRKVSRGKVFLVTDGGLHHNLAASGNFGQVIRKNFPVVVANRIGAAQKEYATVVGPLCTPLDLLADNMQLAVAQPGDLIAIFQSGAYGCSASPLGFLSHPPPLELLV